MDTINAGDTAWIMISSALVLMMVPALGFFYGDEVIHRNNMVLL